MKTDSLLPRHLSSAMWDALPNRLRFFQIVFLADFNQVSRIYFMLEQRGALLGFNLQGGGDVLPTGKALLLQIFVEASCCRSGGTTESGK